MHVGFIEPHLRRYGGIRRILELGNRLVRRGHQVTIYVPEGGGDTRCTWMPCLPTVKRLPMGLEDELDAIIFNHEPHWYLAQLFANARRRVFFALHAGAVYGKEGSWEAARAPVELRLANSNWTAEMIAKESGSRPTVLLGGVNRDHFHPVTVPKRYPILCVGDNRWWKGTETIVAAGHILNLPVEGYADKDLSQSRMAAEYAAAEVFVVGSDYEGFGQPGLEALACGVPLVTTDNGGCREYAIHEETALVVPRRDPQSMARAIHRLRADGDLRQRLITNGLELVDQRFDWDRSADGLLRLLEMAPTVPSASDIQRSPAGTATSRRSQHPPTVSVIVLVWDQLALTQRCVETVRRQTDLDYELIIVDNGSGWEARNYASLAADVAIVNDSNRGFAAGMNQGLAAATGEYVVFLNNDTELPAKWVSRLVESHRTSERAGIVVPAVTEARNVRTVRREPGDQVELLDPFEPPPAAVLYLMRTDIARELGGWGEEFPIASGEDVDLAFKTWVNDLEVVYDQRVLVKHVGKGTAAVKLPNWREIWAHNGQLFIEKWSAAEIDVPRLNACPSDRWDRNLRTARAAAGWMGRYFHIRSSRFPGQRYARKAAVIPTRLLRSRRIQGLAREVWERLSPWLPAGLRRRMIVRLRPVFDRYISCS